MGDSKSWKARGNLGPRDAILHETVSRLSAANQVFLGSWMVDIHQEGCSPRSAPQRRHTAYLTRCSGGAPGKLSGRRRTVHLGKCPPGIVCSPNTRSPELLRPGKGTKTHAQLSLSLRSTQEPEQLRPGKCMKLLWTVPLLSTLEPEQCRPRKHTPP